MNCFKIAWMYRLKDDKKNENIYLLESLKGFKEAYLNEEFPIYGIKRFTIMYLIGELNRRTNDTKEALLWFGSVITSPIADKKIKGLSSDQRGLIKSAHIDQSQSSTPPDDISRKNKKFFSSLFSK